MMHKLVDKNIIAEMLATLEHFADKESKETRGSHDARMLRLAARELVEFYELPYVYEKDKSAL